MSKIIIQGAGTVGQATELFLKHYNPSIEIVFNDPHKDKNATDDDWSTADYVVICVNTDLDESLALPENNTANVDEAINHALSKGFKKTFVLRSTIGIGAVKALVEQLGQHLVVWPEYIKESTWEADAVSPVNVVIGGEAAEEFANGFSAYQGTVMITDPIEAMIAKLSTNTFLAMKVTFANQLEMLCNANDASYDVVKTLLANEGRLGSTHWDVPGPDGQKGFAGKCFPKDVKTFEADIIKSKIHVDLIRAISDINDTIRFNAE
jgi:UDPglucose 6-dehydrogenase